MPKILYLQIPEIFNMLQASVQAVLLGGTVADMDWSNRGILTKSCVEQWPLKGWEGKKGEVSRMASDGLHLYLHGAHGLVKLGSGYGNTKKVRGACGGGVSTGVFAHKYQASMGRPLL